MICIHSKTPFRIIIGAISAVPLINMTSHELNADEPKPADRVKEDKSKDDARERLVAQKQMKQLGLALHFHHDQFNKFPAPAILDKKGNPLLSWRVALLPFLDDPKAQQLHDKFHLDEPWDSEHNKTLIGEMPAVYKCARSKTDKGTTVYQFPIGESTIFPGSKASGIREITDGISNTICIVEVDDEHAAPWTKPDDWKFDEKLPATGLGGHFQPNGKAFLAVMADGSVQFLSKDVPREDLIGLFTRAAGDQANIAQP